MKEVMEKSFLGPSADLPRHAHCTEFHAVHDFINFEKCYTQHASLRGDDVFDFEQVGRVAGHGGKSDFMWR